MTAGGLGPGSESGSESGPWEPLCGPPWDRPGPGSGSGGMIT